MHVHIQSYMHLHSYTQIQKPTEIFLLTSAYKVSTDKKSRNSLDAPFNPDQN